MVNDLTFYILVDFKDGPWGGGNQFLKGLRFELQARNNWADTADKADVILFNSHHKLEEVVRFRRDFPNKMFLHRVDGPMAYRGKAGVRLDRKIFRTNQIIADGTIFQSHWSRSQSYLNGMKKNTYEAVIHNAPDPTIFHPGHKDKPLSHKDRKTRLIACSWSASQEKGFDIYHFLDQNLDYDRYQMTFVGRVDRPFQNIRMVGPLDPVNLARELRSHDLFIFASKLEACSNSLLEALHCGLPAVVRIGSSNQEITRDNAIRFRESADVLEKIDTAIQQLVGRNRPIGLDTISDVCAKYMQFANRIHKIGQFGTHQNRTLGFVANFRLRYGI